MKKFILKINIHTEITTRRPVQRVVWATIKSPISPERPVDQCRGRKNKRKILTSIINQKN